jgi:hypothetical protein
VIPKLNVPRSRHLKWTDIFVCWSAGVHERNKTKILDEGFIVFRKKVEDKEEEACVAMRAWSGEDSSLVYQLMHIAILQLAFLIW